MIGLVTDPADPGADQTYLEELERGHTVQHLSDRQRLTDLLRHPNTGDLPVGFRGPRKGRGEVGPQPFYRIAGGAETEEEKAEREERERREAAGRTFTQAELESKLTDEKRQGKRAATRELMEKLGFATVEEAQKFIDEQRAAQEAQKTDAQRAADEAQAEKDQAAQERRNAATEVRTTRIEAALIRLGVNPGDEEDDEDEGDLPDAVALLERNLDDNVTDPADIRAAARQLKERRPELFAGTSEEGRENNIRGRLPNGRNGKRKQPPSTKPGAAGRARAEARGWGDAAKKD